MFDAPVDDKLIRFWINEVDENLKYYTDSKGIIQFNRNEELTLSQLLERLKNAIKVERFRYGYTIFYKENGSYYKLTARLGNYTTRKNVSPADYFKNYWDAESIFY